MPRARASTAADRPSVLIISAAMGAGHDGVAYELQRRLHARGAGAEVYDYLEMLPGRMGPFYRTVYQGQLKYAPGSYEWLYGKMDRGVIAPVAHRLGQMGKRKLRRLARDYDLVVSTYPLGCQATGALRAKGKLAIPAVGFLTDVDVHGLWLHPGIDRNLTVWHGSAAEAINRVGVPSHAVGPVLPDAFLEPASEVERKEGRELLGLDEDATIVLVVAGSWGVGDIGGTARAIRDAGVGTPVVLCGHNDDLVAELDREDGVIALGWTQEVRRLLAAADVLVHNAGGLSCLEGFAVGVPVIGFACLPGHGHRNSLAMKEAGVAADATTTEELIAEIRRLGRSDAGAAMVQRARALFLSDPTDELLELAQSWVTVPARSAARTWTARLAAVTVAVPVTLGALSFGVAQAGVHGGFGVAEGKDAVYVAAIVDHVQVADAAVVTALRTHRVSAAVGPGSGAPTPTDVRALLGAGVTVVGTDPGVRSRNPRRLRDSINAAAAAIAAAHDERPKVVCLRAPGMVERVVAWDHNVQLALPHVVLTGGQPLPTELKPGQQVVLDERGRTSAQVSSDLRALTAFIASQDLPEQPMRALWQTK
ncbi:MAG: Monogalactosyldiacylglycerol synthase [Frankiales bacterium]|nr:Monogalactosyldiacylglycerol synthase [Frankiales bacterium]